MSRSLAHFRICRAFMMVLCLALLPGMLRANPIHPTAKQVLKDAQKPDPMFIPARAGWNGPETRSATAINPLVERFRPAVQRAANRQALLAIATPDFRIWVLLGVVIFGLRLLRGKAPKPVLKPLLVEQPPAEQPPSYLKAA